jgi:hypothetical protein
MKIRALKLSESSVLAILEGRQTQIRVPVNPKPPSWINDLHGGELSKRAPYIIKNDNDRAIGFGFGDDSDKSYVSPLGCPGDKLWVREKWAVHEYYNDRKASDVPEAVTVECFALPASVKTEGNGHRPINEGERGKWRTPATMPKWTARIWLDVVRVRVEQLQAIRCNRIDLLAEGMHLEDPRSLSDEFHDRWDAIYDKKGFGWSANPWVWVLEFKRVEDEVQS